MAQQVAHTQLYRSRNAFIAGVCAGIAERHDLDPIVIRILAILLTCTTFGMAAIAYIALWAYLPREPEPSTPYEITPEYVESATHGTLDYDSLLDCGQEKLGDTSGFPILPRLAIAVGLMLLFLVVSMNVAPIVSGTHWWQFWPLAFLIVGLCLIVIPVRTKFESLWHAIGIAGTSLAALTLPMSLGVISWETFPYAFQQLWVLVVLAVILAVVGIARKSDALVITASFLVAAFCLATLMSCSIPGDAGTLFINMPDGSAIRIAILAK